MRCKLEGVQGGGEDRLDVTHDYPFKALQEDGKQVVAIETGGRQCLQDQNDESDCEANGDLRN